MTIATPICRDCSQFEYDPSESPVPFCRRLKTNTSRDGYCEHFDRPGIALTPDQERALVRLYNRELASAEDCERGPQWSSLEACRASVQPGPGCVMIQRGRIWLGIEPDGYTHS